MGRGDGVEPGMLYQYNIDLVSRSVMEVLAIVSFALRFCLLSFINLQGSLTVELQGSLTVELQGSLTVDLQGSLIVDLQGSLTNVTNGAFVSGNP